MISGKFVPASTWEDPCLLKLHGLFSEDDQTSMFCCKIFESPVLLFSWISVQTVCVCSPLILKWTFLIFWCRRQTSTIWWPSGPCVQNTAGLLNRLTSAAPIWHWCSDLCSVLWALSRLNISGAPGLPYSMRTSRTNQKWRSGTPLSSCFSNGQSVC